MGGLYHRNLYKEIGTYSLTYGKQEVTFYLDYQPTLVLLSSDDGGNPVCQGDLNYFATTIGDYSFTIYADVKTDYADIIWVSVSEDEYDDEFFRHTHKKRRRVVKR